MSAVPYRLTSPKVFVVQVEVDMAQDWRSKMNDWLTSHCGVVSARLLEDFGCPRRLAYTLVSRQELAVVQPGIFRSPHWPLGDDQKMVSACIRNPSCLVAFTSAAKLWKFRNLPTDPAIHILLPHGCSPQLRHVVVHRCRRIDDIDIVSRDDGIRLTSPTRTLFDCADILGKTVTASVLEQLINDNHGTFTTHLATLTRLGRPRRPGSATMAAVIGSRPAWRAALQSDLESRVLNEITRQALPTPETQFACVLPAGGLIRLDFAWPAFRVGLEVDHPFWHAGAEESHRDKHRDRKMTTVGWRMVRITDLDVDGGLPESIGDVATILHRISPAGSRARAALGAR